MVNKLEYLQTKANVDSWQKRLLIGCIVTLGFYVITKGLFGQFTYTALSLLLVFTAYVFEDLTRSVQIDVAKSKSILVNRGILKFRSFFSLFTRGKFQEAAVMESVLYGPMIMFGVGLFVQIIIIISLILTHIFYGIPL